jgi:hypothetical protein
MSKVSTLTRHARETFVAMLVIACLVLLSGCGGGSDSASAPPPGGGAPPPSTPAEIDGIATPTSVAVVTATNTQ